VMIKTLLRVVATAGCLALVGCASDPYVCPEPSGVACMSARQVYKLTDPPGKAGIEAAEGILRNPKTGKLIHPKDSKTFREDQAEDDGRVANASIQGAALPLPHTGNVIPVVEPPRVMRVWIGPWVDSHGNLHMAQRVYTQIVPRRWSIGTRESTRPATFFPLDAMPSSAPSKAPPNAPAVANGTD